ncbi:MAG: trehalose-phosphatase [Chloroflexota bacterium]|nr:trehalose-phosphatase [Chloroflexota bacterium]
MATTDSPAPLVIPPPADVGELLRLLRLPRAGIITDIDGTIAPIAATPGAARVDQDARRALMRLIPRLTLVVALTGRRAEDGARLVSIPELPVVGNHGMEMLAGGTLTTDADADAFTLHVHRVIERMQTLPIPPGTILEDKGPTASVHYRLAPNQREARAALFALLEPLAAAEGLWLTEGRALIEIRPPVPINKGYALRRLCAAHTLDSVVMFGDDLTDVDAFDALRDLRAIGDIAGLAIGVVAPDGTAPPSVLASVDAIATGVTGVAALLTAIADGLGT